MTRFVWASTTIVWFLSFDNSPLLQVMAEQQKYGLYCDLRTLNPEKMARDKVTGEIVYPFDPKSLPSPSTTPNPIQDNSGGALRKLTKTHQQERDDHPFAFSLAVTTERHLQQDSQQANVTFQTHKSRFEVFEGRPCTCAFERGYGATDSGTPLFFCAAKWSHCGIPSTFSSNGDVIPPGCLNHLVIFRNVVSFVWFAVVLYLPCLLILVMVTKRGRLILHYMKVSVMSHWNPRRAQQLNDNLARYVYLNDPYWAEFLMYQNLLRNAQQARRQDEGEVQPLPLHSQQEQQAAAETTTNPVESSQDNDTAISNDIQQSESTNPNVQEQEQREQREQPQFSSEERRRRPMTFERLRQWQRRRQQALSQHTQQQQQQPPAREPQQQLQQIIRPTLILRCRRYNASLYTKKTASLDISRISTATTITTEEDDDDDKGICEGEPSNNVPTQTVVNANEQEMDSHCNDNDNDESQVTCAICLLDLQDGDRIGDLVCGHYFHASCLKSWLHRDNACPLCKLRPVAQWVQPPPPIDEVAQEEVNRAQDQDNGIIDNNNHEESREDEEGEERDEEDDVRGREDEDQPQVRV